MAATTRELVLGTQTNVLTTELNSMANSALVLSAAFDNTIGAAGLSNGYVLCDLELVCTFGTNPTANTGFSVWFLRSQDGTNYEDGGTSLTPVRLENAVIPVGVSTSAQRLVASDIPLPPGKFKILIKNNGTGQSLAATANTLKIRPYTDSMQ